MLDTMKELPMGDCKRVQDILSDYLEGSLSGERHRRIEGHIHLCPTCRNLYEGIKGTVRLLGSLPAITPSDVFEQHLKEKIRAERYREHHRIRLHIPSLPLLRPWPVFTLSLAVVIIGLGFIFFRGLLFPEKQPFILANGASQTKIERLSSPSGSTSVSSPFDVVHGIDQTPNYILSTFPSHQTELSGQYDSPFWEAYSGSQFPFEEDPTEQLRYQQHTVRYILPSVQPQTPVKAMTFNP
jgi:hypothetical protein